MKITQRFSGWMLLVGAVAACGVHSAGVPVAATRADLPGGVAGCYALESTRSLYYASPRLRLNTDTIPHTLLFSAPDSIPRWTLTRLDADGHPMVDDRHVPALYWSPHSADSLRILVHTGLSGSELFVAPRSGADTLRGRAREHWDMGPMTNDAGTVILVRVPCSSER